MNILKSYRWKLYYKFFHPREPRQISSGSSKIKDQISVERLLKALGYPTDGKGVCYGLIKLWNEAVVAGKEEAYFKRLRFIEDLAISTKFFTKSQSPKNEDEYTKIFSQTLMLKLQGVKDKIKHGSIIKSLLPSEQSLLDAESFLEAVVVTQYPCLFSFLHEKSPISYTTPAFSTTAKIYDAYYLGQHDYFEDLNSVIGSLDKPHEIAINLDNLAHTIGLRYVAKNKWLLVETNSFPGKMISTNELKERLGISFVHVEVHAATTLANQNLSDLCLKYAIKKEKLNPKIDYSYLLIMAAHYNDLNVIRELLKASVDINTTISGNRSALSEGVAANNSEVVTYLLEQGADVNGPGRNGKHNLAWAARNNSMAITKLLLTAGVNVNEMTSYRTALYFAASKADDQLIKLLIESGAIINTKIAIPLHSAARWDNAEAAKALIQAGALVDLTDQFEQTALIIAAENDSLDVLKVLMSAGANINHSGEYGTALEVALNRGHARIVDYIGKNELSTRQIPGR